MNDIILSFVSKHIYRHSNTLSIPIPLSKTKLEQLQQHLVLKRVRQHVILPTHFVIVSLVVYASLALPGLTALLISALMHDAVSMVSVRHGTLVTHQVFPLSIKPVSVTRDGTDHFVINKMP